MAQVHSNPDLFTAVELQSLQSVDVAGTSLDSLQGRKLYDQLPEDSPLRILSNSPGDLARALHPELWPVEGDEPHLQSLVVDISDPGDAADQMAFHRNALLTNRSIVLSQTGSQLGALQHATEDILNAALQHAHRLFRGENEPAVRTDWNFVHATMTANNRYLRGKYRPEHWSPKCRSLPQWCHITPPRRECNVGTSPSHCRPCYV